MSRKDGVLALLVVVVWGLNFVVIKVGLHNMPPLMLAGLRFMLVAFPAIFFVARPKVPLNLLLGYGLTISFAQFAFLFCAINFGMPAGLASLVLQAQAFFTIVLGAFTFGERLHGKQLAGIALAIFGVLVLIEESSGIELLSTAWVWILSMGSRGLIRKILAISGVGKVGEKVSKVPMILIPHSFSIYENLDFCICDTVKSGKRATDIHVSSNCAALSSMNRSLFM